MEAAILYFYFRGMPPVPYYSEGAAGCGESYFAFRKTRGTLLPTRQSSS